MGTLVLLVSLDTMAEYIPLLGRGQRIDVGFQSGTLSLQGISNDIQLFNKNVQILERRIGLLNTAHDSSSLKQEIIEMVGDTVQLAKLARTSIDKVKDRARSFSQPEKVQFDRLLSTFKSSVSKFQHIQQSTSKLEQEMLSKARSSSFSQQPSDFLPESEREGKNFNQYEVADSHFQEQRQAQIQADAAALEQREREMHQLEHDIVDINDIFRDLGVVVNEQGEMIDNIESNVETAGGRVVAGNEQLVTALRHKKCSRKLTCVIAVIIIGVVVVVIIVALILICTLTTTCRKK